MARVLVVGAGITGALTAALLRRECANIHISVWEKARGPGGRMTSSRSPKYADSTVDLGLQYITVTPELLNKYSIIYNGLISSGILQPVQGFIEGERRSDPGTKNFACPKGFSTLVKYFLAQAEPIETRYGARVTNIKNEATNKLQVFTDSGHTDVFDTVILTLPVPQLFLIEGCIQDILGSKPDLKKKLQAVTYSSRFCLGIYYPRGTHLNLPWTAKYIDGHPCIRYVCVDSCKRGADEDLVGPSLLVHTSVPYSIQHVETDKEAMKPILMEFLNDLLPNLPQPDFIKSHKWRYSQISKAFDGSSGCICLLDEPQILIGGDAFTRSKFDGCIQSAENLVSFVLKGNLLKATGS